MIETTQAPSNPGQNNTNNVPMTSPLRKTRIVQTADNSSDSKNMNIQMHGNNNGMIGQNIVDMMISIKKSRIVISKVGINNKQRKTPKIHARTGPMVNQYKKARRIQIMKKPQVTIPAVNAAMMEAIVPIIDDMLNPIQKLAPQQTQSGNSTIDKQHPNILVTELNTRKTATTACQNIIKSPCSAEIIRHANIAFIPMSKANEQIKQRSIISPNPHPIIQHGIQPIPQNKQPNNPKIHAQSNPNGKT